MKIKEIKTHIVESERVSFRDMRGLIDRGRVGHRVAFVPDDEKWLGKEPSGTQTASLTRIITDEDIEGWCTGTISNATKEMLIGRDPLNREYIWEMLWHGSRGGASGVPGRDLMVVDVAIWDILGKYFDVPVYKLLGGFRDKVPAYMSSHDLPTPDDFAKEAAEAKRRGLMGYKMHSRKGPKGDIEVATAVREAVGDDFYLMHDPNASYSIREAVKVGRALEKLNFYWFEEVINEFNLVGLRKICRELEIPILTGEVFGRHPYSGIAQVIAMEAGDIVRNHADRGGITGMMKIAHLAESFGMNNEPCSTGPMFGFVHAQALGAMSNSDFYESWNFGEPSESAIKMGVRNPLRVKDGCIHLPEKPGLGVELDLKTIEKKTVKII